MPTSIVFDLLGRDRGASAAVNKVGDAADKTSAKLRHLGDSAHGFGHSIKAGFGLAAGAIAAAGLAQQFSSIISEAREAGKVSRITAAAIKSTGGAAHISAKQISDLAQSISNKVGVDDEAIQSSQNLLLTFTNVRNEAGRGNDVFSQASQAIVDMTAAMHGGVVTQEGMKASTIQVGKALQDPIKGLTALGRVGVAFTKQQKDQIIALVKSGHTMEAQKIILRELGKEFGGAAAAASDPMQRLNVVVNNLKERIGVALLPYIEKAALWLGNKLPGALSVTAGFITGKVIPAFRAAISFIQVLVQNFRNGFSSGETSAAGFAGVVEKIGNAVFHLSQWIKSTAIPALAIFAEWIKTRVVPAVISMTIWLRDNVLPVVIRVARFLAEQFAPVFKALADHILNHVVPGLRDLVKALRENGGPMLQLLKYLGLVIGALLALAIMINTRVLTVFIKLAGPVLGLVVAALKLLITWTAAFEQKILETARIVAGAFLGMISQLLNGIAHLMSAAGKMPGPLGKPFREAALAVNLAKDKVDKLRASINATKGKTVPVTVNISARDLGLKTPRTSGPGGGAQADFATGGWIPGPWKGPRADNIPIMANPREYVVQAPTAMKLERKAPGFLDSLNAGRVNIGGDAANTTLSFRQPLKRARGGSIPSVQQFIRSTDPKPYVWGAAGPGSYDCSGLVGAVYGLLTGRGGGRGQRYFTTDSIGGAQGFRPGLGTFSVGVTAHKGHMAGNLAGLPFEAASTQSGIHVGKGVSPVTSFARKLFLPQFGNTFGYAGITGAQGHKVISTLAPQIVRALAKSWGVKVADNGGWVNPGLNVIHNGTGRSEQILPPGSGQAVINITINGAVGDRNAVVNWVRQGIREGLRSEGRTAHAATI